MQIPATIRAGSTIQWRDAEATDSLGNAITIGSYALTYFLRFNAASKGATVVGTAYATGWEFTISATTSAGFDAGTWYWQAIATSGSLSHTLGAGQSTVEAALNYTGTPAAFEAARKTRKTLTRCRLLSGRSLLAGLFLNTPLGPGRLRKWIWRIL